jgi:acetyl-CoA C-acetyltransferase
MLGCGEPAGESGFNLARVVAILAGMPDVPGVTANRYCSSSLQTIRMAFHAISALDPEIRGLGTIEASHQALNRAGVTINDIALGHSYGMAGARIMTTLLNGLQTTDKTIGLETMCVAGGQGLAMIIERLS